MIIRGCLNLIGNTDFSSGRDIVGLDYVDGNQAIIFAEPAQPDTTAQEQPGEHQNPGAGAACHVEKHYHTKRASDFWLVVLDSRVDREEFVSLRDRCKQAGGWYSRKWGKTPGGFAFDSQDQAEAFALELNGPDDNEAGPGSDDNEPAPQTPSPAGSTTQADKIAERFRKDADNLQKKIDDCNRERPTHTNRMLSHASAKRCEGMNLEAGQLALRTLADAWEAGTVPDLLQTFRKRAEVLAAVKMSTGRNQAGYYQIYHLTSEHTDNSDQAVALREFIDQAEDPSARKEREKTQELQKIGDEIKTRKIIGYFPTPCEVVEQMIEAAEIEPGQTVLEPSAGSGHIAEAAQEAGGIVECIEIDSDLARLLELKELNVTEADFTTQEAGKYDRVLLNPPFEDGQDREHEQKAFEHLKSGGRLVAIMSPGPFFRSFRADREFRKWFEEVGGTMKELPEGSFRTSDNPTGVSTRFIVIDKPGEPLNPYQPARILNQEQAMKDMAEISEIIQDGYCDFTHDALLSALLKIRSISECWGNTN